ncbi:MAG: serine/threonine protein phosphatase 1 [Oceanicaulis sp. HLUCCA04]|nr:MAG: serine/threonine protein phosphatase 1 [Oceanicaulis sp. HLUCCA04]
MFDRLKPFFMPQARAKARPAGLAPGVRLYAVGDVHGQDDLLDRMLARIRHDTLAADGLVSATLIMLGDYVDRGHGSARVIERLSTLTDMPFDVRFLKGNHEQAMLDFLADPAAGPVWVQYGGGETMAGYGVKPPAAQAGPQAWREAQEALARAIPDHHRAFLDGLEPYVVEAPYMFVHAGVDPAKPLAQQSEQDFYWIREKFLYSPRRFEYVVVHGHTPEQDYFHDDRRIGIDTGAYLTGVLTAVRLEGQAVSFLQTRRGER